MIELAELSWSDLNRHTTRPKVAVSGTLSSHSRFSLLGFHPLIVLTHADEVDEIGRLALVKKIQSDYY